MKKRVATIGIILLVLYACEKNDWEPGAAKTYTQKEILCVEPWNFDIIKTKTHLNGSVVEDYSDSVYAHCSFLPDYTLRITTPGGDIQKFFWSIKPDTLTINDANYLIEALSGTRLQLQQGIQKMLPDQGIAYTETTWKMTR